MFYEALMEMLLARSKTSTFLLFALEDYLIMLPRETVSLGGIEYLLLALQ
jgi:hypothetical protein